MPLFPWKEAYVRWNIQNLVRLAIRGAAGMLERSSRSGLMPNDIPPRGGNGVLRRLPAEPASCGDARAAIRDFCRRRSLHEVSDDAQLLTSELVSNAVRHASSSIALSAVVDQGALLVIVTDDGPGNGEVL